MNTSSTHRWRNISSCQSLAPTGALCPTYSKYIHHANCFQNYILMTLVRNTFSCQLSKTHIHHPKYILQGGDSVMRSKLFLLNWCPETSPIKWKMLYASRWCFYQMKHVDETWSWNGAYMVTIDKLLPIQGFLSIIYSQLWLLEARFWRSENPAGKWLQRRKLI